MPKITVIGRERKMKGYDILVFYSRQPLPLEYSLGFTERETQRERENVDEQIDLAMVISRVTGA